MHEINKRCRKENDNHNEDYLQELDIKGIVIKCEYEKNYIIKHNHSIVSCFKKFNINQISICVMIEEIDLLKLENRLVMFDLLLKTHEKKANSHSQFFKVLHFRTDYKCIYKRKIEKILKNWKFDEFRFFIYNLNTLIKSRT